MDGRNESKLKLGDLATIQTSLEQNSDSDLFLWKDDGSWRFDVVWRRKSKFMEVDDEGSDDEELMTKALKDERSWSVI